MSKINTTVADPKDNVRQKAHTADAGPERKADMSVVGDTSLRGATSHLYDNLEKGVPHMPLHGLKPSGRM